MKTLPSAADAVVDIAKTRDYLLVAEHPQNGGKAIFFKAFGFDHRSGLDLQHSLLLHGKRNPVIATIATSRGTKYVLSCNLETPDGRNPCVRSIWVVDEGMPPRLITAYPS